MCCVNYKGRERYESDANPARMAGAEGVLLERPRGAGEYILLHFWQPMHLLCGGEMLVTKPDACVIFSPDTPQKFYNDTHDMVHD